MDIDNNWLYNLHSDEGKVGDIKGAYILVYPDLEKPGILGSWIPRNICEFDQFEEHFG